MRWAIIAALLVNSWSTQAQTVDSCKIYRRQNDSLKTALFNAKYRIEKVRFYVNIVNRNPSQIKYLKGWIIRAIR